MAGTLTLNFSDDGFATIQMVNGENRFQTPVIDEWNRTLDSVLQNQSVRGLLITGSGKFFSNGIDLQWLGQQQAEATGQFMSKLQDLMRRILVFPVPTAALINGHAFGGGAFLALACDFRIMRPDRGWLNWPETAIGLRFGEPLLQLARTKIPAGKVQREALLFAKRLSGPEAKDLDLVDHVVEDSKMADVAKEMINKCLGKNGLGRDIVRVMKKDIYGKELDLSKL
ncbi:uncharacterized protein LOC127846586 [Dreissena polymorpha]|uniref:Enoyl-CoA hydratase n=1 Tax=Dreissena polymorpha TaxID=45954 RepID=A0A9D4DY32_DREPO|nr:uncharacterized protein LOC127846586 [Dreissena polymorpha]KAH3769046.1 hypothetical protein DPMN_170293 [Dreissena polymorpha]